MSKCLGLAALLAITLNVGCINSLVRPAGMTWSITKGNERCHLLKLPDKWKNLDHGGPYINTPYEIRRNGQSGTQVFIGVAHQAAMGIEAWRSKNYGLDLAAPTTGWPVGAAEWDKAAVLPLSAERCLPNESGSTTCRCDSKDFPKSGKWDDGPIFSSSHRWLAVNTWNGSSNRQLWQSVEFFVDVYRVDTGEKAILLTAHVDGGIALLFLAGIRWLGDDFLIIPVHESLEEFLICDLRERPRPN
jgi:hypothetical protein